MVPPPTHGVVVVDVPQHIEYHARLRAIRNNDQENLVRYIVEYLDREYEALYYHTDHDADVRRSTANLGLLVNLQFQNPIGQLARP